MNKNELKKFVTKVFLEKLEQTAVHGKLIKKTINFRNQTRLCTGRYL